jgi:anaerobic selenocysteine-containing dehydrogenase
MPELRKTLCNRDCPDACSIVAHVEKDRVVRLTGDKDHPITQGFLCYRTNQFLHTQYHPERLTTPLLRKDGTLTPVSWDEALAFAAERLLAIRSESGPAAIFHYRSGGSLGLLKVLSDYFFERFGPCTVKRGDICSGGGDAAQLLDFGVEDSNDVRDLLNARHIVLWGKNIFVSSPHLLPVLRQARARGARLTLVDPTHNRSAELCDQVIQPRPGCDFTLGLAVANVLYERGWVDPSAEAYCDNWSAFRQMACETSLATLCREADVEEADAVELARRIGPGKPTAILVGWGMARRVNGAGIVRVLDALGAVSGNLGLSGGGVSYYYKRRGAFDVSFMGGQAAAPRTICEPLFGPDLLAQRDPPVRAVWVTCGNPVTMLPESQTIVRALESCELVVVLDSFLTDTARLAHLVLPTTTLLEADDLLGAYGHHYLGVSRPVVSPPEGVKSDLEIIQALAARVGLGEVMAGDARSWKRRLIAGKLEPAGVTLDDLERGPVRNPFAPPVLFADHRFATPSGKVNLVTARPPMADSVDGYPLSLLSLSTDESQSSQWARESEGPAVATIHPDVARAVGGLGDGQQALLQSPIGAMTVVLRYDARQRRDVVIVPKGGHLKDGRCANALIRARTTDAGEGGALYDQRVRLVPL